MAQPDVGRLCKKVSEGDRLTFTMFGKEVVIDVGERTGKAAKLTVRAPREVEIDFDKTPDQRA